jgi:hypothetical protein
LARILMKRWKNYVMLTKMFKFLNQCFARLRFWKSVSDSRNLLDGVTAVLLETLFQNRSCAKYWFKNLNILEESTKVKLFWQGHKIWKNQPLKYFWNYLAPSKHTYIHHWWSTLYLYHLRADITHSWFETNLEY